MKTEGFVTRKMSRLEQERKDIRKQLLGVDTFLESILEQAIRLTKMRNRWKRNLARVESDISKLTPRMKCEEKLVAKAMSLPGTEIDTHGMEKIF